MADDGPGSRAASASAVDPGHLEKPVAEPITPPPSRRAAILRTGVLLGVLFVVFGLILPQFVDYRDVLDAFLALTLPQVLLMTVLGIVAWVVSGQLFTVLVGQLTALRGTSAYLILSGIGASIPMGPWNFAVLWVVLRGWGVTVRAATSGIALYGLLNTLGALCLPLVATIVIVVTDRGLGIPVPTLAVLITVISIVAFLLATGLIIAILRSDRAADWIARTGQRLANWVIRRLGRSGGPDVDASLHRFRDQVGEVLLHRSGVLAMLVAVTAKLVWWFVLLVALRVVGVADRLLTPADVLAVYALVNVIILIPIAPGGAGLPEILYIAGLSAIAGAQLNGDLSSVLGARVESLITAGVFLFRLYQWFLPIPIAWILMKTVRRGKPVLPMPSELRGYTRDVAA